jgi:hypothetical protein
MHECNAVAKIRPHAPAALALCLSSQPVPFIMGSTYRKCGANEGQMRHLTGYLVARSGAEQAAAQTAVCISQPFLCKDDRVGCAHVLGDASIGTGIAARDLGGDGTASGSPTGIVYDHEVYAHEVYARENILDHAIEAIAGAIPDLGLFD